MTYVDGYNPVKKFALLVHQIENTLAIDKLVMEVGGELNNFSSTGLRSALDNKFKKVIMFMIAEFKKVILFCVFVFKFLNSNLLLFLHLRL